MDIHFRNELFRSNNIIIYIFICFFVYLKILFKFFFSNIYSDKYPQNSNSKYEIYSNFWTSIYTSTNNFVDIRLQMYLYSLSSTCKEYRRDTSISRHKINYFCDFNFPPYVFSNIIFIPQNNDNICIFERIFLLYCQSNYVFIKVEYYFEKL